MFVKELKDCEEFVAGDHSILRELLHPRKGLLKIRYSLAHARVVPGQTTSPHRLETSEVYYILEGKGIMNIDHSSAEVSPGCAVYIPPGSTQSISNVGSSDLKFLCIVDPAWRPEDERVLETIDS